MWLVSYRRQKCWLKGLHQILSVNLIFHHSLLPHLLDCLISNRNVMPLSCYYKCWGDGIGGGGWFILGCRQGDRGWVSFHSFSFFCCVKLFQKSGFSDHFSVDFLRKGKVFWFQSLFWLSTLLYSSSLDF